MSTYPACDLKRFSALWALAKTAETRAPDYYFSHSRGPQLTHLEVTVRTTPPGPIARRGAGIIHAVETTDYRELNPELDMTFSGTDGEEGNDDFEPAGPRIDNPGFSITEYAIEHHDEPKPLLEGAPKTAASISAAASKLIEMEGYTRQQVIQMITRLCMGTDIRPTAALKLVEWK